MALPDPGNNRGPEIRFQDSQSLFAESLGAFPLIVQFHVDHSPQPKWLFTGPQYNGFKKSQTYDGLLARYPNKISGLKSTSYIQTIHLFTNAGMLIELRSI